MFLNVISSAKDEMIDPISLKTASQVTFEAQAGTCIQGVSNALKQNNALDFDDLL